MELDHALRVDARGPPGYRSVDRGDRESVWIGPARRHAPEGAGGGPRFLFGRLGHLRPAAARLDCGRAAQSTTPSAVAGRFTGRSPLAPRTRPAYR